MSSGALHVVAIITPAFGKEDRVRIHININKDSIDIPFIVENDFDGSRRESQGKRVWRCAYTKPQNILYRPLIILQSSYQIFEEIGHEGARVFVLEETCTSNLVVEKLSTLPE
jgi:hypothetical protein